MAAGFTEGNLLLFNGQKYLRSVTEDLISNKQKTTKRTYLNGEGTDNTNVSGQYF